MTLPAKPIYEMDVAVSPAGRQSFSIFFPVYNEEKNLPKLAAEIREVIPTLGFADYEVLFIDDGSKDRSVQVIEELAREDRHIRLVRHPHNLGYGSALRTGFQSARSDLVFYTDSDLPAHLSEIRRALPYAQDYDVVIGYRIDRQDSLRRAVYSRVYNALMRTMFGVKVRDVNFSFKLVKRHVLDKIKLSAESVFIDGQLLAEAVRHGFRIVEIPVEYKPRQTGASSFNTLGAAWHTLVEMVQHRVKP